MDRGVWQATVHRVTDCQTQLRDKHFVSVWFLLWDIMGTVTEFTFLVSKITSDRDCSHEIKRCILLGRKAMTKLSKHIKKQRRYFTYKVSYSQSCGFSSSHVWMWELDHKEGWEPKNWCFWTVVLEKTLESPLDGKEIKSVNPKGNQSWIFTGRTDTKTEAPVLWSPDAKSQLIRKDWERLKGGREGDDRGWDGWMALLTQWTGVWASSWSWWREAWYAADHGITKSQTQLRDWTTTTRHHIRWCFRVHHSLRQTWKISPIVLHNNFHTEVICPHSLCLLETSECFLLI